MSQKTIDSTLVHFGIRKDDLQLIETIAHQHGLNPEWVKGLLGSYQSASTGEKPLDDAALKKLLDKELQNINN